MRKILHVAAALATLTLPGLSHAALIFSGDVTGGGNFSGSVNRANAWVEETPIDGLDVNFWTLSGYEGDTVSFKVSSSALEFGMSFYQGLLEEFDLIVPGFENSGDFANLSFINGTPDFGATGTELMNIVLPATGTYLLAIGGEGFGFLDSYAYDLDVASTEVPAPAALWLFGAAMMGVAVARRRRA
jgi:hypothetical protein